MRINKIFYCERVLEKIRKMVKDLLKNFRSQFSWHSQQTPTLRHIFNRASLLSLPVHRRPQFPFLKQMTTVLLVYFHLSLREAFYQDEYNFLFIALHFSTPTLHDFHKLEFLTDGFFKSFLFTHSAWFVLKRNLSKEKSRNRVNSM